MLHISYHTGIMFNAFNDPLCSILCWHNRRVPIWNHHFLYRKIISTINRGFQFVLLSWLLWVLDSLISCKYFPCTLIVLYESLSARRKLFKAALLHPISPLNLLLKLYIFYSLYIYFSEVIAWKPVYIYILSLWLIHWIWMTYVEL